LRPGIVAAWRVENDDYPTGEQAQGDPSRAEADEFAATAGGHGPGIYEFGLGDGFVGTGLPGRQRSPRRRVRTLKAFHRATRD
jgi:hypothetical protein